MPLAYSPDQISAFWVGVGAIAGVFAAAATLAAAIVAILTLRALARDSADRTRPLVIADLERAVLSRGTAELIVRNVGPSVAWNVRATFSPPIEPGAGVLADNLRQHYERLIPTLGPGREMIHAYAQLIPDDTGRPDESVPEDFTLTVDYEDSRGQHFQDIFPLTLKTLGRQTTISTEISGPDGLQKRVAQAVESIARNIGRP